MSKQPFLPLFFGDLLASTAAWEGEERALYVLLLAYQWTSGPLPADPKRIAKMAQYDFKTFMKLWEVVRTKFPQGPDGLANSRLEEHRTKSQQIASKRAEIGRRGGEASGQARAKQAPTKSEANASDLLEQKRTIHPIPSQSDSESLSPQSDRSHSELGQQPARAISEATRACLLLREAGFTVANPHHPGLIAALAAGVTPDEIRDTAQEFPQKPLTYWLATATGRRADPATVPRETAPRIREGQAAWDRLIATDGAARDARVQIALEAVGGWLAIKARTPFTEQKMRAEFCRAYADAAEVAA